MLGRVSIPELAPLIAHSKYRKPRRRFLDDRRYGSARTCDERAEGDATRFLAFHGPGLVAPSWRQARGIDRDHHRLIATRQTLIRGVCPVQEQDAELRSLGACPGGGEDHGLGSAVAGLCGQR